MGEIKSNMENLNKEEISKLIEKEKREYLYKFVAFITSVGSVLTPEAADKVRKLCDIVNS